MAVVLKRQQFEDGESEEMKPKVSKRHCVDMDDIEKGQNLDKYEDEDEGEDVRHVSLLFLTLPSL